MKTLRYFAFAASILAVACAKENNEPVLAEAQEMTFSASAEEGYTKTGLEEIENGAKVLCPGGHCPMRERYPRRQRIGLGTEGHAASLDRANALPQGAQGPY